MNKEPLSLSVEFPPVSTADWDAAIAADLNGAGYETALVWRTEEGIPIQPFYRREDIQNPAPVLTPETWREAQNWEPAADAVRADLLHEAGATSVQELAFALAEAVEKIAAGFAGTITFVFAVGSNYFFEIAKFRAIRVLWDLAADAFVQAGHAGCAAVVHARTSRFNKSIYTGETNLLRAVTESMSAVLGGCDSLDVVPFGFDARLALNLQRVLRDEAHLDYVSDPAAGSYYLEVLTDALAHEAWRLFQRIENSGGWAAALASGLVEREIKPSRLAKFEAVAARNRTLVEVNDFPTLQQKTPACEASPLPQVRLAEPFERIRMRTARHASKTGRFPRVLLVRRGDLRMKSARANFSFNFFGCGGFDVLDADEPAEAELIVLCSSDSEYLAIAWDVCPRVTVPVLVAGYPKDFIDLLKGAGVRGFVHAKSNMVETLTYWQDQIGMEA